MDWQTIAQWGWTVICLGMGWWLKTLFDAQKELRADLANLAKEIPRDYVSKVDLQPILSDIRATLGRIEQRLDSKADKP